MMDDHKALDKVMSSEKPNNIEVAIVVCAGASPGASLPELAAAEYLELIDQNQRFADWYAEQGKTITELRALVEAKQTADALLKEAKNLFDGTLALCDEVNSDEWIWKWRVRYYFEETDIPPHELPEDMKVK